MNFVGSNNQSFKYQRFTPSGWKNIKNRKLSLWQRLNSPTCPVCDCWSPVILRSLICWPNCDYDNSTLIGRWDMWVNKVDSKSLAYIYIKKMEVFLYLILFHLTLIQVCLNSGNIFLLLGVPGKNKEDFFYQYEILVWPSYDMHDYSAYMYFWPLVKELSLCHKLWF